MKIIWALICSLCMCIGLCRFSSSLHLVAWLWVPQLVPVAGFVCSSSVKLHCSTSRSVGVSFCWR